MTNEVEELILTKYNKKEEINYSKHIAYKFYKIIWKYILRNDVYDYKFINISFKAKQIGKEYYINQSDGVNYEVIGDSFKFYNQTYFKGYNNTYVENVLNTNIDLQLLLDLLVSDEFAYMMTKENDGFSIKIFIEKNIVEKTINNILTKNKVLKREL